MNGVFGILLLMMCLVGTTSGQVMSPVQVDLSAIEQEYLPEIRDFDPSQDMISRALREIDSPYYTSKVIVQQESDLTRIAYDESLVKASVVMNGTPFMTFLIRHYKSYEIFWLDDEVFQITNWPGRCLELITIYSVLERRVVYQTGFQHCGD